MENFIQLVRRTWRVAPGLRLTNCTDTSRHCQPTLIVDISSDNKVENVAGEVWLVTPALGE